MTVETELLLKELAPSKPSGAVNTYLVTVVVAVVGGRVVGIVENAVDVVFTVEVTVLG